MLLLTHFWKSSRSKRPPLLDSWTMRCILLMQSWSRGSDVCSPVAFRAVVNLWMGMRSCPSAMV